MTNYNAPSMPIGFNTTWEAHGYSGAGNVGSLIDSLIGRTAIICGSAHTVFAEFEEVLTKVKDPVIFAANDVGMYIPRVDHWASLHYDGFPGWKQVRWIDPVARGVDVSIPTKIHSISESDVIDYVWDKLSPIFVLSGYFAAQIAFIMGAEKIILCGCPGSQTRRFFETKPRVNYGYGQGPSKADDNTRRQFINEMERLPEFREKLRSMNGWTRSYLGGL